MANILQFMPELNGFELQYIQSITDGYTEKQLMTFSNMYRVRRKDPQLILLVTLIGFLGFAGIQRFIVGQIGMGIVYFFTAGLCVIGTIIDLINYQDLAFRYNQQVANETKMHMDAFAK